MTQAHERHARRRTNSAHVSAIMPALTGARAQRQQIDQRGARAMTTITMHRIGGRDAVILVLILPDEGLADQHREVGAADRQHDGERLERQHRAQDQRGLDRGAQQRQRDAAEALPRRSRRTRSAASSNSFGTSCTPATRITNTIAVARHNSAVTMATEQRDRRFVGQPALRPGDDAEVEQGPC